MLKFNVQSTDNVTLDTGARSFGVDLGSTMGVSEIKLTPNAQPHRVRQRDLTLFVSTTNNPNDYSVVTGYKFTNQGGSILLQLATVVQARYIKVKTDWDDRDLTGAITDSYATFTNTASALLQVVVLKTSQNDNYTYDRNGNRWRRRTTRCRRPRRKSWIRRPLHGPLASCEAEIATLEPPGDTGPRPSAASSEDTEVA